MTKYNLYISTQMDTYNILGIPQDKLDKVVSAYKKGQTEFSLGGKKYWIKNLHEIQIFTHEKGIEPEEFKKKAIDAGEADHKFGGGHYLSPKVLAIVGKNVTDEIIGDSEFGEEEKATAVAVASAASENTFVNESRIEELKKVSNPNFDLTRLIRFCEEINTNYSNGNYLSVAMLGRSIINHIPPIFGLTTFVEVCGQYGGASFKKIANHLNTTMRSIADSFLHDTIRKKESLPNSTQVNFSQDLDFLLAEIIRKLNE